MLKRGLASYLGMQQEETYSILQDMINNWKKLKSGLNGLVKVFTNTDFVGDGTEGNPLSLNKSYSGLPARVDVLEKTKITPQKDFMFTNYVSAPLRAVSSSDGQGDGYTGGYGQTLKAVDERGESIPNGVVRIGFIKVYGKVLT